MDETRGLSEKQKKSLYIPGTKFGRRLKPGEFPPSDTPSLSNENDVSAIRGGVGDSIMVSRNSYLTSRISE